MCEMPKVFEAKQVRARKLRRCVECGIKIRPGTEYISISGLWEDGWSYFGMCIPCDKIQGTVHSELLKIHGPWECMAYGQLWETAEELEFACLWWRKNRYARDEEDAA